MFNGRRNHLSYIYKNEWTIHNANQLKYLKHYNKLFFNNFFKNKYLKTVAKNVNLYFKMWKQPLKLALSKQVYFQLPVNHKNVRKISD